MRSCTQILLCCGLSMLVACGDSGGDPIQAADNDVVAVVDIFVGASVPPGGTAFDETAPDGTRVRGFRLDDGTLVGPYLSWHANGVKAAEGSYDAEGRQQAWWHRWHDNGGLQEEGYFQDDVLDERRFWVRRDASGTWLAGSQTP